MKKNCWEFKKCGREPGGFNELEIGACPAAMEQRVDGVNGGICAGRACWAIAGTLCDGRPQGSFARKIGDCMNCDFYVLVQSEECKDLTPCNAIMKMLT